MATERCDPAARVPTGFPERKHSIGPHGAEQPLDRWEGIWGRRTSMSRERHMRILPNPSPQVRSRCPFRDQGGGVCCLRTHRRRLRIPTVVGNCRVCCLRPTAAAHTRPPRGSFSLRCSEVCSEAWARSGGGVVSRVCRGSLWAARLGGYGPGGPPLHAGSLTLPDHTPRPASLTAHSTPLASERSRM